MGGGWRGGWLTPTTYIQLAGAGSKTFCLNYIDIVKQPNEYYICYALHIFQSRNKAQICKSGSSNLFCSVCKYFGNVAKSE